jgi:hypothetical protein
MPREALVSSLSPSETIALSVAQKQTCTQHVAQTFVERGVSDAAAGSKIGNLQLSTGVGKDFLDAILERAWCGRRHDGAAGAHLEGEGGVALDQVERDGRQGRCGTRTHAARPRPTGTRALIAGGSTDTSAELADSSAAGNRSRDIPDSDSAAP